jgi:enamine deaminase RidA (YjgF/YER057c/UK114 family)
MTLRLINPGNLPTPPTYTHVVIATGSALVFIAGQEPEDEHGNLVGPGDLDNTSAPGDAGKARVPDRGRRNRGP